MTIQTELIEKYALLLMEYIHLVNSSEIIPQLDNSTVVFQIGLNALAHIYKLTFLLTKNVESAGCYTQKGMYCYLEYIEQMNRTNTLHNLDNMDAVLFVYDKTLSDLYSPTGVSSNNSHQQNMFSNILSLNHPHADEHNWKHILENICYITKTVLWFDNPSITYLQRIDLTHEQLEKWLLLLSETNVANKSEDGSSKFAGETTEGSLVGQSLKGRHCSTLEILKYVSTIQEKCVVDYNDYVLLLDAIYKAYKKSLKQRKVPKESTIREKCIILIVFFSGKTFNEIIESDYGKSEGWKTILDIVKWLF